MDSKSRRLAVVAHLLALGARRRGEGGCEEAQHCFCGVWLSTARLALLDAAIYHCSLWQRGGCLCLGGARRHPCGLKNVLSQVFSKRAACTNAKYVL